MSPRERKKKHGFVTLDSCVPFQSMHQFKCFSGHGAPRLEHVRSPLKPCKRKVRAWAYAMRLGPKLTKHGGSFAHLRLFAAHGAIYSVSRPPSGKLVTSRSSMEAQRNWSWEMVWLLKAFLEIQVLVSLMVPRSISTECFQSSRLATGDKPWPLSCLIPSLSLSNL